VRGTVWAVDVTAAQTSVFVAEGVVEVGKAQGGETVQLRAGEGVDVQPAAPLRVNRWGEVRAKGLLGRFGR
jgi:ferric-dicitrate binding protein FerR (iron transport regulator)